MTQIGGDSLADEIRLKAFCKLAKNHQTISRNLLILNEPKPFRSSRIWIQTARYWLIYWKFEIPIQLLVNFDSHLPICDFHFHLAFNFFPKYLHGIASTKVAQKNSIDLWHIERERKKKMADNKTTAAWKITPPFPESNTYIQLKAYNVFDCMNGCCFFFLSSVDVCNAERIAIATQRTKKQRRVWRQDNGNHLHNWHENSAQQNKWKCFLLFVFPAHTLSAKIAKNGFLYLPFSVFIQKTIKSSVVLVVTTTTTATATIKCWIVHVTLVFSILMLSAHFKNYSLSSQDICSCHLIIERRINKLQIYNFLIYFPLFIREDKKHFCSCLFLSRNWK